MVNLRSPMTRSSSVDFFCEETGPPDVSAEELAFLDKQAMYTELERLRKLEVNCDVLEGVDVSQALHLDTKLVRQWRFRQGSWIRRARMVAREFRGQSASTEETFSPTTPLMMVKILMVISLVKRLPMSALDVSDAFLQVMQREDVVVSVPNWVRMAAGDLNLMCWQLLKQHVGTSTSQNFLVNSTSSTFKVHSSGTGRRTSSCQSTSMISCWWPTSRTQMRFSRTSQGNYH